MSQHIHLFALLGLGLLAACNSSSSTGQRPDEDPNESHARRAQVHGQVQASGAQQVQLRSADGEIVESGDVDDEGGFTFDAAARSEVSILVALNAQGEIVASGLLESIPDAETQDDVYTAPLNGETHLEAEIYQALSVEHRQQNRSSTLRERVRAELAAAVDAAVASGETSREQAVAALAGAVVAAEQTAEATLEAQGNQVDEEARAQAELTATMALHARLFVAQSEAETEDAIADWHSALASALYAQSVAAEDAAEAELIAARTFQACVTESLGEEAGEASAWGHAELGAMLSGDAAVSLMSQVGAEAQERSEEAATDLYEGVSEADPSDEAQAAWESWSAELVGDGDVEGSFVVEVLGEAGLETALLQSFVALSVTSNTTLSETIALQAQAAHQSGEDLQAEADDLAEAVAQAYVEHQERLSSAWSAAQLDEQAHAQAAFSLVILASAASTIE